MGKLAFWRALEGAGKGIVQGAAYREESRQKQMQRDYEMRLAQMKIQADREMATERNQLTGDIAAQQAAIDVYNTDRRVEQETQQHTERMTTGEQQHAERMAAQDRSTEIAGEQLGLEKSKFERERWKVFQVQERTPVEGEKAPAAADPNNPMAALMGEEAQPYETRTRFFRYDQQEGVLQEQVNGKWKDARGTLEGPDKKLYENPSQWQEYVKRAGELPGWFVQMYGDPREALMGAGGGGGGR